MVLLVYLGLTRTLAVLHLQPNLYISQLMPIKDLSTINTSTHCLPERHAEVIQHEMSSPSIFLPF